MAECHEEIIELAKQESVLPYSIHKCSSYSTKYHPENVLVDNPKKEDSRWASDSTNPPQYLILKLSNPAIVKYITFGKYEKNHVCSLKKFKVFGGMNEDVMIELLDGGLNADSKPETFKLKHQINGSQFTLRYIKIVPIQAHSPSFNFSIWFIELRGCDDHVQVKDAISWFTNFRQREAIRLCLKHLRQHNFSEAFDSLQKRTKVQLEDELLTRLHLLLVIEGNFSESESLLESACSQSYFNEYLRKQEYKTIWKPLVPSYGTNKPGMRGGHQMCIDPKSEIIYLFGGWNGSKDLADLWSYHIRTGEWKCISKDTSAEGGPTPRSCHKMCIDPVRKRIFTLGRYIDSVVRLSEKSDFYMYDIETNQWTLITDDTEAMGGPKAVFDHQMCMDVEKNTIYVFGGRTLSNCLDEKFIEQFSGLYSYHVPTNSWILLRDDISNANPYSNTKTIKSRIGHSMLFHEKQRILYIFAGNRNKEFLKDFFTYNIDTDTITMICDGEKSEVPASGFTQRATIDPETNEIFALSGINKDKKTIDTDKDDKKRDDNSVKNSFWVYDIQQNRWSCIYKNETATQALAENNSDLNGEKQEPVPRFAHQLVYDPIKKVHYLFGGNGGKNYAPKLRLDDFWTLELSRITKYELLRKCKRLIREQAFRELINKSETQAVYYLQHDLASVFNHNDEDEANEFRLLASLIFKDPSQLKSDSMFDEEDINYSNRTKVFDSLVEYFPDHMTQPKVNLVDLVSFI